MGSDTRLTKYVHNKLSIHHLNCVSNIRQVISSEKSLTKTHILIWSEIKERNSDAYV